MRNQKANENCESNDTAGKSTSPKYGKRKQRKSKTASGRSKKWMVQKSKRATKKME